MVFCLVETRSEQKLLEFGVAGGNRQFPIREVLSLDIFQIPKPFKVSGKTNFTKIVFAEIKN